MIPDLARGARCLLLGFDLIRRPGTRRYVIVPAVVNSVLFAGLILLGGLYFDQWLERLLPTWLGWLEWLLWPIFAIAVLAASYYSFTLIANLLASPFNDRLAARVAEQLGYRGGRAPQATRGIARSMLDELRKWLYFAGLALLVLLVWLVPVVNLLAPLAWLLLGVWMMAIEYADYPMANEGLSFAEKRAWLRGNRGLALGFGAATLAATLIPLVNFLVMPAAVAGATALWVEQQAAGS